jgi:hypothetical protein
MQLVAGILRRDRLQPKGPRDIAKLLADNDVAAASGWPVPQGLEQVKRLSAAHLADRDAVQAQSQRRADEIGQRGDTVLCAQCHQVGSGAPTLPRILDEDDADRSSWPPRQGAHSPASSCPLMRRRRRAHSGGRQPLLAGLCGFGSSPLRRRNRPGLKTATAGLRRRQVYRLARAYLLRGPAALASRRRGKPSNRSYPSDVRATATCRSSFLAVLSQPEHLAAQVEIVAQVFGRPLVDHPAALQRYRGIRQR